MPAEVPTVTQSKIVVSCFDQSTNFVKPWADAGYLCYCVDVQHDPGEKRTGNIIKVGADIREWLPPRNKEVAFAAFFPPCTDLAVSGAGYFKKKGLGRLSDAIELFYVSTRLAEWFECPYLIENPVSTISSYWRKPDHSFDPCDYGDNYTKKTCLWTGGGFRMPVKNRVPVTMPDYILNMKRDSNRAISRSVTPMGFANAVYRENS